MISEHREGFGTIAINGGKLVESHDYDNYGCNDVDRNKNHEDPFVFGKVINMHHSYPFRFLVPENACNGKCHWIYPVTFGGGLVAGDQINVEYKIGDNCAAIVNSQESTKIYHCLKGEETVQHSIYHCGESALLCVLMEPVVCYKDARFSQKQIINLKSTSNLVFLDWMLAGRVALNESWDFKRFCNTVEIYLEDELVLRECSDLEDTILTSVKDSMGEYQVLGTCVILGSYLHSNSNALLEKYGRKMDLGETRPHGSVVSVSPVSYRVKGHEVTGCYLRFMALDITTASSVIRDITQPLLPILGADPFERKL